MRNMVAVKLILLTGLIFTAMTTIMVYQIGSLWLAAGLVVLNVWLGVGVLASLMEDHHHDGLPK